MGRKLRVQYAGAIYHLMNRGDRREAIFVDDTDRRCFLRTLGEACEKTGWRVHAYCLMSNHFHLIVETPRANLVDGMKWFLGTYTGRFNRRHRLFGHLFSGRYKALIVDQSGNGYLKTVCDYAHLNPVRAKLLRPEQSLREYRWSSWPEYLKRPGRRVAWLRPDRLLGEYRITRDNAAGRRYLEECVERRRAGEEGRDYKGLRRGWFFGDKAMKQALLEDMKRDFGQHHQGEEVWESEMQLAESVVTEELKTLGWCEEQLDRRRKGDKGKARIARRLRTDTTMSLKWIARRLRMGSVSMVAHCLKSRL
jgi:REP element-mobilizing transposase RayT